MTYYAREYTDPAGGALTITTDHQGLWITATEGREEVTVGPFPATTLADDMDGGVTAALIEQEQAGSYTRNAEQGDPCETVEFWKGASKVAKRRAEKAEQERDEVLTERDVWEERLTSLVYSLATAEEVGEWSSGNELDQTFIDHMQGKIQRLERATEQPRPLAPDAITDEMVTRALVKADQWDGVLINRSVAWEVLTAALTEPPARPEGAEELARLIADADVGEWDCGDLADALLATGRVRLATEEES